MSLQDVARKTFVPATLRNGAALLALIVLALFAWYARNALLLGFGGLIVATILVTAAQPIKRWTPLGHRGAVWLAGLLIALALAGLIGLIMPTLTQQAAELSDALPAALDRVRGVMGETALQDMMSSSALLQNLAGHLTRWSAAVMGTTTSLFFVLVAGGFFAMSPQLHRDGLVSLVAPSSQERTRAVLDRAGKGLRAWLFGQMIAMVTVGAAVTLGTWLLGLPAPLALGVIAGLLEFVPVLGPVVAALPGVLLAMTISPTMMIWTAGLYILVEQLESNMLLPMVEQSVADVPPAVFLLAIVAIGSIFGIAGVILSAPMTVVAYVLISALYIDPLNGRDTLPE